MLDLTELLQNEGGHSAVIAIALFVVRLMLRKGEKNDQVLSDGISGLHEKVNAINLKMATSGMDDLKKNIEDLKESKVKHEMQLNALFKLVDRDHAPSPNGKMNGI